MGQGGPADPPGPPIGHATGCLLGQPAQRGIHPGLRYPAQLRQAGALHSHRSQFRSLALAAERLIEMQQPQRVGAEPAHPGGDRPPGGQRAAMAHGRGDGLLDQLHPSRLGQRLVQGPGTGIGYLPADLFDAQLGLQFPGHHTDIGGQSRGRGLLIANRGRDGLTQGLNAHPGQRGCSHQLGRGQPLGIQQAT